MNRVNWKLTTVAACVALAASTAFIASVFFAARAEKPASSAPPGPLDAVRREGDRETAYLLVKLLRKTRAVIAGHYTRKQSGMPGVDLLYQRTLAKNRILPAAVADEVFSEVVPHATGGRAWVKMVVPEPRNPRNRGDDTALEIFEFIRGGAPSAERHAGEAYYYGEPIAAKKSCLPCHGEPKGAPDPLFPQYKKNGWRDGEIIGAVVARVESRRR